jgi:hypothetical protein
MPLLGRHVPPARARRLTGQVLVELPDLFAMAPAGAEQPVHGGMDARVRIVAVGLPQPLDQRLPRGRRQMVVIELAEAEQERPPR